MDCSALMTELNLCATSDYHLALGASGSIVAEKSSPPGYDYSPGVHALAQALLATANRPIEPLHAQALMQRLHEFETKNRHGILLRHFMMRTVIEREKQAFAACKSAAYMHITNAYLLDLDVIQKSLQTLIEADDPIGFATVFSAMYRRPLITQKGADDKNRELAEKHKELGERFEAIMAGLRDQHTACTWLKKDAEWFCDIAKASPHVCPKELTLIDCDEKTVRHVLEAHGAYLRLKLILNCSQELFLRLPLQNVFFLDLEACTEMDWKVIQNVLTPLKTFENLTLPKSLKNADCPLSHAWRQEIRKNIENALSEVKATGALERAKQSAFMKGVAAPKGTDYSRPQTSFRLMMDDYSRGGWYRLNFSGCLYASVDAFHKWKIDKDGMELRLQNCPNITLDGFKKLFNLNLTLLDVSGCLQINDDYFTTDHPLFDPPQRFQLSLDLSGTSVKKAMIARLRAAQPNCTFHYDRHFLDRLAKKEAAHFGMDRQGLSKDAFDAVLHFSCTGRMPLLRNIAVVIELAEHPLNFFTDVRITQFFKRYIRAVLLVNVTPNTVVEIYRYAASCKDISLLQQCHQGVHFVCGPGRDPEWERRDAVYKAEIQAIPVAVSSEDFIWMLKFAEPIDIAKITFCEQSLPLFELVERKAYRQIALRLQRARANDSSPEELMAALLAKFPQNSFLQQLHTKLALITAQVLDLTGLDVALCDAILFANKDNGPLKVILDSSVQSDVLQSVAFLDLRGYKMLHLEVSEPKLARLPHLTNVLFPNDLECSCSYDTLSMDWSEGMDFLVKLRIIRALQSRTRRHLFEMASRYHQFISVAGMLQGTALDTFQWKKCDRLTWNFVLATNEHLQRATFPTTLNLSGLEIVTGELIAGLNFEQGPLTLDLAHCCNVTLNGLKALFSKKHIQNLSLFGCMQVTDDWFQDSSFLNGCKLDLRGTQVRDETCRKLDAKYASIPEIPVEENSYGLSAEAFATVQRYRYIRYRPMLSVPIAMELLTNTKINLELRVFAREHIMNNVSESNWQMLCNFRVHDNDLQFAVRSLIELFRNPYYHTLTAEDHALAESVTLRAFPKPFWCDNSNLYVEHEPSSVSTAAEDLEQHMARLSLVPRGDQPFLSTRYEVIEDKEGL